MPEYMRLYSHFLKSQYTKSENKLVRITLNFSVKKN
jgi:hypothetical protein